KLCCVLPVQRIGSSRQSTCAQRTGIHPDTDVTETSPIPFEHLKISAHMMSQCNRLCFLKMGKSSHVCMYILFHDLQQRFHETLHQMIHLVNLISHIQLHIQSHLIIPASSRVKLLSGISDSVDQIRLHKTVNIFIFTGNFQSSGSHIIQNSLQAVQNLL